MFLDDLKFMAAMLRSPEFRLNSTDLGDWDVDVRRGSKNKNHKDTRLKEIKLPLQYFTLNTIELK